MYVLCVCMYVVIFNAFLFYNPFLILNDLYVILFFCKRKSLIFLGS